MRSFNYILRFFNQQVLLDNVLSVYYFQMDFSIAWYAQTEKRCANIKQWNQKEVKRSQKWCIMPMPQSNNN